MRILLVTSKYHPSIGGLETAVRALNCQLRAQGHETVIITNRHSRHLSPVETIDETTVYRFFFTSGLPALTPVQIAKYPARLAAAPAALVGLKRIVREFLPDVVNLHFVGHPTAYLLLALREGNLPLIVSLHGEDVETDIQRSAVRRQVFRNAIKSAAMVTSNSRYLLEQAAQVASSAGDKGIVVGNGFEPFKPVEHVEGPQNPFVLAVARMVYKKGIDVLLEAFRLVVERNSDVRLIIAGDGPERQALDAQVSRLGVGDRVTFVGPADRSMLASLLSAASVYCLPSRREPFGIVLLEALSFGLPVVATKVGGVPEVLDDGEYGYLVPPEDPPATADAIVKALEIGPPQPAGRLISMVTEKYNWQSVANRYMQAYEKALERNSGRLP